MPPKAVLFDFDGTLADSYPAIAASVNHVRARRGQPPLSVDEVRRHVGRGLPYLLQQCVSGADLVADAKLYRDHHPSVLISGTQLLPEVSETLRALCQGGLKLAICSNKPRPFTEALVRALGLVSCLTAVLGPEDVPRPKPAPDMLIEGLKRLGVRADEALYVGDMTIDIATARAAGVAVWLVPTGSDTREALEAAKPDRLLDSLNQLADLLGK